MSRNTGRRQWDPTISGASLQRLREREELSRREVAEHLSEQLGRPVAVQHIREMEEGAEPSQEVFGYLMDLLKLQPGDELKLYPPTEAELDRQRQRAEDKAAFERRVEATDKDWQPVRFRK
jgi:transcriptional regulator with XRE-family HTH domain